VDLVSKDEGDELEEDTSFEEDLVMELEPMDEDSS